jgi:antitoxin VapB
MAMNIKNEEAHALAREIAARAGISLTDAVLLALREKQAAMVARGRSRQSRAEALLDYGRRLHAAVTDGSSDTSDLYDDELGLPR